MWADRGDEVDDRAVTGTLTAKYLDEIDIVPLAEGVPQDLQRPPGLCDMHMNLPLDQEAVCDQGQIIRVIGLLNQNRFGGRLLRTVLAAGDNDQSPQFVFRTSKYHVVALSQVHHPVRVADVRGP